MTSFRRFALVVCLSISMLLPFGALAQSQPTGLSVSPGAIYKPPGLTYCYTIYVAGGANMTVDLRWKLNNGADQFIYSWPQLDSNGQAHICTDNLTAVGQYSFTGVRNTLTPGSQFLTVAASLTVLDVPTQATTLTFNGSSSSQGYAGIDSYTLHAANTAMSLILEYTINCSASCPIYTGNITLNSGGNFSHLLLHDQVPGIYRYSRIRNALRSDWLPVNATYTIRPPLPTSLSLSPGSVVSGDDGQNSYTLTVGNGANIFLDARYRFTPPGGVEGPETSLVYPFWLSPAANDPVTGQAIATAGDCTPAGRYRYTWITNHALALAPYFDLTGMSVNKEVTVVAGQPAVFSVSPSSGIKGTGVNVTISGKNFCGDPTVTISPPYPGLTVDVTSKTARTIAATFTINAAAVPGIATVLITTSNGTRTFTFIVASPNPPTVTTVNPTGAAAGSTVQVSLTGANLLGSELTTNYAGLTFSNVVVNNAGSILTAVFNVAGSAAPGSAVIIVTTPGGSVNVAFAILAGGAGTGPSSTREYVYIGDRILAVESWAASTQPPPPPLVSAQVLGPNTVQVNVSTPSLPAGSNSFISAKELKRDGQFLFTMAAGQTSFIDATVPQHSSHTYTAVAKDNTLPVPLVSANSNAVTVSTPYETTPPTAPGITFFACDPFESYWVCYMEWSGATDSGGSGLAGYVVWISGYGWSQEMGTTSTSISFFVSELTGVGVAAIDNAGNRSDWSTWSW